MAHRITQEHVTVLRTLFEEALRGFGNDFAAGQDLSQAAARVHSAGQILLSAEVQLAREELSEARESGDFEKVQAAQAVYDQRLGVAQEFDILHQRADRRRKASGAAMQRDTAYQGMSSAELNKLDALNTPMKRRSPAQS